MKFCEYCGHKNEIDDDYCRNCGKSLKSDAIVIEHDNAPKTTKHVVNDFFYLIYCVAILIITAIVTTILYLIFGFWIELINMIIWLVIIFGCASQLIVAFFDWIHEKNDLKKKRKRKISTENQKNMISNKN